jgi:glutamate carboxypeptidase
MSETVFSENLAKSLQDLVEINSGSANEKGVDKIQSWMSHELKKLGFSVEIGKNRLLVANLKGEDDKTITFLVHADTVFEPTSKFQKFSKTEDGKATGPGVIDEKGGVVVALEGLRLFLKDQHPQHNLRFVSSPSEEIGSKDLQDEFRKISIASWILLGFEPSLDNGSIVESRRGGRWYDIIVTGREAHSGRAHKDGINACHEMAHKIADISKLTDYSRDVTVSFGHMTGGQDKYNIICGQAEAKLDTRFAKLRDREILSAKIKKILDHEYIKGAKTTFEIVDDTPPLAATPEEKPFIDAYVQTINQIEGGQIKAEKSGGGADTSFFGRPGLIIIDGLGVTGGKMHSENEFVTLSSLSTRSEALHQFLISLQK